MCKENDTKKCVNTNAREAIAMGACLEYRTDIIQEGKCFIEYDEELDTYTASVDLIDLCMYGNGDTKEGAIENLINDTLAYIEEYKYDHENNQFINKVFQCSNTKDLKKVLELK